MTTKSQLEQMVLNRDKLVLDLKDDLQKSKDGAKELIDKTLKVDRENKTLHINVKLHADEKLKLRTAIETYIAVHFPNVATEGKDDYGNFMMTYEPAHADSRDYLMMKHLLTLL